MADHDNPLLISSYTAESNATFDNGYTSPHREEFVESDQRTNFDDGIQESEDVDLVPPAPESPVVNGIMIASPKVTYHQGPVKINLLTRPQTSHEDPALGFSFTKAKPTLSFDFSRKPQQSGITAPKQDEPFPIHGPSLDRAPGPPPPTKPAVSRTDQDGVVDDPAGRSIEGTTFSLDDPRAVPFPLPNDPFTPKQGTPPPKLAKAPGLKINRSDGTHDTGSMSGDETLIASGPTITVPTHDAPPSVPATVVEPPQVYSGPSRTPMKAAKSQKKNKRTRQPHADQDGRSMTQETTEEDLLSLLSYKMYKGQQEREEYRAMQHAKDCELEDLKHLRDDLYLQLQETKQRSKDNDVELDRIKSLKLGWETKIKRLGDYVQGLSNDHNCLRKDAQDIHTRQVEIDADKQKLMNALHAIQQDMGRDTAESKRLMVEGRHQIELHEQTVRLLQNQIREDEDQLEIERGRNSRLENDISRITTSHEQLLSVLASHRDFISENMDDLLNKAQTAFATAPSDPQDHTTPLLEQCILILQELRSRNTLQPEDFNKLDASMSTYNESIIRSMKASEHNSISTLTEQQRLVVAMQDQIRELRSSAVSERTLLEQVMDLREVRATMKARLQGAESTLKEAHFEAIVLRNKEEEQSSRISDLQAEIHRARSQCADIPQTLLRLQEIESQNKDLVNHVALLQKEAAEFSEAMLRKSEHAATMNDQLSGIQLQLEEAQASTTALEEERLSYEKDVILEREILRKDLSQAATMELANVKAGYMNESQQLKEKIAETESKLDDTMKDVDRLSLENQQLEQTLHQATASLELVQGQQQEELESAVILRERIAKLERDIHERDCRNADCKVLLADVKKRAKSFEARYVDTQKAYDIANAEILTKNNEILTLKASMAQGQSSTIKAQPSQPPLSIRSEHFVQPPAVIKDSQPGDLPAYAALTDIMASEEDSNDPFLGYVGAGSQSTPDENLFGGLFPSTPGGGTQEREFSRVSISRETVTSRSRTIEPESQSQRHKTSQARTLDADQKQLNDPLRLAQHLKTSIQAPGQSGRSPIKADRAHAQRERTSITVTASPHAFDQNERLGSTVATSARNVPPKGILKESRGEKRTATTAEMAPADGFAVPKKKSKVATAGLGPVIADSQSPSSHNRLAGRGRKMSSKPNNKAAKDDKFARRFSQELNGQ